MIDLRELTQNLSQGLWTDLGRSAGAARQGGQTNTHCRLLSFPYVNLYLKFENSTSRMVAAVNSVSYHAPCKRRLRTQIHLNIYKRDT